MREEFVISKGRRSKRRRGTSEGEMKKAGYKKRKVKIINGRR